MDGNTEHGTWSTEDRECARRVKGAASMYVLCPHLTDKRAFQFKRERDDKRCGQAGVIKLITN